MGIGSEASLIVAAMDLQLVRLLRGAIAKNRLDSPLLGPCDRLAIRSRLRAELTRNIDQRPRIEPEPRFEPRKVIRPEPRFEPRPVQRPVDPEQPVRVRSPIQPPWRVLPHEIPSQPPQNVKLTIFRPDVIHKGTLLDLFI